MDRIAALHQNTCAFRTGRAGADDQHVMLRLGGFELLRMPAAAIFLACRGVLRADERNTTHLPARDADVTADARPDVVDAAFIDLARKPGISDRGTSRADDVDNSRLDDLQHLFRIIVAANADNRFLRCLFNVLDPVVFVSNLIETRRAGVLAPFGDIADVDVPQVEIWRGLLDELQAILAEFDAFRAVEGVDSTARHKSDVIVDGPADLLQRLDPEAGAVIEAAAVLVGTLVVVGVEPLHRAVSVCAVDVHQIEAGITGAQRGIDILLLQAVQLIDVGFMVVGKARAPWNGRELRIVLARTARDGAGFDARGVWAAVEKFAPGERSVAMHVIDHGLQVTHVALIPDAGGDAQSVIALGMDRALFGVDRTPAAFGFDAAVGHVHAGRVRAGAVAVRHLIETIADRLRAEFERREKNVETWVSCHCQRSLSAFLNFPYEVHGSARTNVVHCSERLLLRE